jgi:hypothetical protein
VSKIDLGGGSYLEPDEGPRNTAYHKRIVSTQPIPGTRAGHNAVLECGHRVRLFGKLEHAGGIALCMQCRDGKGEEQ